MKLKILNVETKDLEVVEFSDLFHLKINKATLFLLPLLSHLIDTSNKKKGFVSYLIENLGLNNVYLSDNLNFYKNCLFLSFKRGKIEEPLLLYKNNKVSLIEYFTELEEFIDIFENDEDVIFVYKIPSSQLDALEAVKNSKYSQLDKYATVFKKNQFDTFLSFSEKVITKDEKLKKVIKTDLLLNDRAIIPEYLNEIKSEDDFKVKIEKEDIFKLKNFMKRCLE